MSHLLTTNNYHIQTWGEKFPNHSANLLTLEINHSWSEFFNQPKIKKYIERVNRYMTKCLTQTQGKINIYPYPDLVFNALNLTPLNRVKVVILGQDPYFNFETHNGKMIPQAMGLSFSVPGGITVPSSLENIYKNQLKYGHITRIPNHGNLSFWALQGCLLLNTALTVQYKCPNSHSACWKKLTDRLIEFISNSSDHIVFVLWGANALEKLGLIDSKKHKIIISSHPSGHSYAKPLRSYKAFADQDHFGLINKYLNKLGKPDILWELANVVEDI